MGENLLTLGQYIAALVEALGEAAPAALLRMRHVVGNRRARILLDDEAADVVFLIQGLSVRPALDGAPVDGEGATDSPTVMALLDGNLEVTEAILTNRLRVSGKADDIARIFTAIEILLDASDRAPALQALAAKFIADRRGQSEDFTTRPARESWYPFICGVSEGDLLARLGLLPPPPADLNQTPRV